MKEEVEWEITEDKQIYHNHGLLSGWKKYKVEYIWKHIGPGYSLNFKNSFCCCSCKKEPPKYILFQWKLLNGK